VRDVKFIIVLGGGFVPDASRPAESRLDDGSIARLVEGARASRLLHCCKLILSGGPAERGVPPMAQSMALLAQELGVDRSDMILDEDSPDTEDEARHIAPIVREQPFILVTEASHMPRALALFRKQGTNPIADPVDFRTSRGQPLTSQGLFPDAGGLSASERAVYEYLGLAWAKLRGKI
jgi:uncharacterized SAM-binding protein YcdF (DUF218 family)